jgi:CheY-like chemotaxis protein
MARELRILILEDVPTDAELIKDELVNAGITFTSSCVTSREYFLRELDEFSPHIILSDYSLPAFDGLSALKIATEKFPNIPFIFVSGALGE